MSKHTEQFKLQIVQSYLNGIKGYGSISKEYGVKEEMVRLWVRLYQAHGQAGLSKKHTRYSAEFKLNVLQQMRKHALSRGEVAARFNIRSMGCISQWANSYHHGGIEALAPRVRGKPKASPMTTFAPQPTESPSSVSTDLPASTQLLSLENLQSEVDYLRMEVAYLKKLQALVQAQASMVAPLKRKS